ncbi:MAG: AAA family ATPase [Candidatus Omnitrophica bacterium]|nr:AAA family ATPase [Candidatus Omnitrophota bacterium]
MIIGLTGKNGSGKGEVARFLKERGFEYLSLSDVVREEVKKHKKPLTRDNLVLQGNELRKKFGADVLAKRILDRIEIDRNYVIDSIRHPSEVKALKSRNGFVLLNVTAPSRVRFGRLKKRKRESDPKTFQEFLKLERWEGKSGVGSDQQLNQAIKLADYTVNNDGTLEEFRDEVTRVVMTIAQKKKRPNWDEYFLGIAKVVALRSNCVKRKVASVIVKDKRIISTGYNGTPRGVKNCNEGGCPRCNQLASSGTKLEECLCSHGEENAITQSAYHGVNIKDSTLYTTYSPCLLCTKMIINSGIREVVFNIDYPLGETSMKLLEEAGVVVRKVKVE